MALFSADILKKRQQQAERAFGENPPLVLIGAGNPISKPGGLDQTYPFIPHPEYLWLTGSTRWGGVLAFDPQQGWTHFVRPVTPQERLWEGDPEAPEGKDVAQLSEWLNTRSNHPIVVLGSPPETIEDNAERTTEYRTRLDSVRRIKDAEELALLKTAVHATASGHAKARETIRPGASERLIQIELEAEMFRNGAHSMGYGTIVGAGTHAAILHFAPGEQIVQPEDLVLIDAGGAVFGYTADVTRTYPATQFTPQQKDAYDLVMAMQQEAISKCHIGTEWHDVHRVAATVLARGLIDLGILNGNVDELLDTGAIALFFPHGIGHMVGLGVRDVGGRAPGREVGRRCCGVGIRVDLPLEENLLMTVEPGLYFVPAILDDPQRREEFKQSVDWDALESWRSIGGIRIED
ncbi:MAG: M24 family metallopeptidase, partial [bacterium]|nr:M24 family metallopeptidase [bacterium]